MPAEQTIAVALHGIEPATFERCALIRDWLTDHGIDRVTLLVIPARDLHPVGERSPEMVRWLRERHLAGDSIAQHGFQHLQLRRVSSRRALLARNHGMRAAEFAGLDDTEARRAVDAGWRVLKLAGIEPDGFVAPAYAYTAALRRTLALRFKWWAGLLRVYRAPGPAGGEALGGAARKALDHTPRGPEPLAPAWSLGTSSSLRRGVSPLLIRAGALLPTSTLRLDLHPADLQRPRHIMALERVLARAGRTRTAITYQELMDSGTGSEMGSRATRALLSPITPVAGAAPHDHPLL